MSINLKLSGICKVKDWPISKIQQAAAGLSIKMQLEFKMQLDNFYEVLEKWMVDWAVGRVVRTKGTTVRSKQLCANEFDWWMWRPHASFTSDGTDGRSLHCLLTAEVHLRWMKNAHFGLKAAVRGSQTHS